ncbi:hypothetical protein [Novosphingobium sp.]
MIVLLVAIAALLLWMAFDNIPLDPPSPQLCFDFDYEHLPR